MATLLMGKAKKPAATDGDGEGKKISLKVSGRFGGLVHKIAAMRGKTVEELCDMHILAGH